MNQEINSSLTSIIENDYSNVAGLMVYSQERIIYKQCFGEYTYDQSIHVASVTKSVISMLMGIAIQNGQIQSVEQKVLDFFPNYIPKRGEKTLQHIKIKHLLSMNAPYKFKYEPYTKVYSSEDWTQATLDLLGGKAKIGEFKYTTVGIQILSGILAQCVGSSLIEYAEQYLFQPLGINTPENVNILNKDAHFAFIKQRNTRGWVVDPNNINTAGWGLAISLNDMLKLGQLYLNEGLWQGKQIIDPNWIKQSSTMQSKYGELEYGYLWWLVKDGGGSYAAIGDGGNIIYICPKSKTVIVIASHFMPRAKDRIELIHSHILPSLGLQQ